MFQYVPIGSSWLGKMAKLLFIFFSFLLFGLTIQGRSMGKCHMTDVTYYSHMLECHSVVSYNRVI